MGALAAMLVLLAVAVLPAASIDLIVSGGTWNAGTFGPANLSGGAGADFANPTESSVDQVIITVADTALSWELRVRRSSDAWPAGMSLAIRRSSDSNWHEITTTDTVFFSGSGSISDVQCQLRVMKAVAFGADTFIATVTYTVTEL